MDVLLIGGTGHVGAAVREALAARHRVIVASRSSEPAVDVTDPASVAALYDAAGSVDAVVVTLGKVPFKPLAELTIDGFRSGFENKVLGQLQVVLQGIDRIRDGGSFTLTTGIVGRELIRTGTAAAVANGAADAFVRSAAAELPRGLRINAVSPNVLAEATAYHPSFPGFIPVPAARVAQAYVRAVEGVDNGRIFAVD